jgi:hypothetical protein
MFIECPICPIIVQNAKEYVLNTKFFLSPDFVKKRYHKHFGYSLVLTFFAIWFLFKFAYLGDTGYFFQIFVGGFGAFAVNWVREWYYAKFHQAPWDDVDIHMGSYGGIVGTILFLLTYVHLIN